MRHPTTLISNALTYSKRGGCHTPINCSCYYGAAIHDLAIKLWSKIIDIEIFMSYYYFSTYKAIWCCLSPSFAVDCVIIDLI